MSSAGPVAAGTVLLLLLGGCTGPETNGPRHTSPPPPDISFADVTATAGLSAYRHVNGSFGEAWAPEIVGGGGGWVDFDGDEWPDIVLVAGGAFHDRSEPAGPALVLYRNRGDGTFIDVTASVGLSGYRDYSIGFTAGDYDNDGDEDLFVSSLYENRLFRNDDGTFTDVSLASGLADESIWSTSTLFFDADNDGWLDLFVGNYVSWTPETDLYCGFEGQKVYCTPQEYTGYPSRFYHNNGDGTFSDYTEAAGFAGGIAPEEDKTLGVAELDFNRDGWPDLFVANDTERDLLYQNNGDGTFTERGVVAGVAFDQHGKPRAGMGAYAGVVDSTGEVSLFVGNFSLETVGVYHYQGNGLFLDRAAASRVGHSSMRTLTFGLILFDVELDGDLDLFTANGHVQTHISRMVEGVTFRERPQLYLNDGHGSFHEFLAENGPLTDSLVARGAAYADYDRDGDLDLLVTENNGPAHLWRNDTPGGAFLRVVLEGRQSNRSALGARVEIVAGGRRQERRIRTGSSYLSVMERAAVFGLGSAVRVDTVRVSWPSGRTDVITDLSVNRELVLVEGSEMPETRTLTPGTD